MRDPLTFESALAASIVQNVATEGLPQGALVLAVVSVPDDDACKAILSHTIFRTDKTLACLCQAAADRRENVLRWRLLGERMYLGAYGAIEEIL